jgi:hypothetical protein
MSTPTITAHTCTAYSLGVISHNIMRYTIYGNVSRSPYKMLRIYAATHQNIVRTATAAA